MAMTQMGKKGYTPVKVVSLDEKGRFVIPSIMRKKYGDKFLLLEYKDKFLVLSRV